MPLVFACIAPHGSMAIPEAKPQDRPSLASATTAGMQELGRRFAAAEPDVSVVLTPHNIHVEGAMAVIDAGAVSGDLAQWGTPISMRIGIDRELALSIRDAIRAAGIPVVAVSYGANDPVTAVFPMDWAVLVPAPFMGGRSATHGRANSSRMRRRRISECSARRTRSEQARARRTSCGAGGLPRIAFE